MVVWEEGRSEVIEEVPKGFVVFQERFILQLLPPAGMTQDGTVSEPDIVIEHCGDLIPPFAPRQVHVEVSSFGNVTLLLVTPVVQA